MAIRRALFVLGVLLAGTHIAAAGDLSVQPLKVHIKRAARSNVITLQNLGKTEMRLQVTGFSWHQSLDGDMVTEKSDDLVFFPQLLDVAAGETRTLRVGLARLPVDSVEHAYRIFVEELPSLDSQLDPVGAPMIYVRTKMGIPVFLDALRPAPKPAIVDAALNGGKLAFAVANTGNAHFTIDRVRLRGHDAGGRDTYAQDLTGWYLLADEKRRFVVPLADCARLRDISIVVTTDAGEASATLPVDGSRCS